MDAQRNPQMHGSWARVCTYMCVYISMAGEAYAVRWLSVKYEMMHPDPVPIGRPEKTSTNCRPALPPVMCADKLLRPAGMWSVSPLNVLVKFG